MAASEMQERVEMLERLLLDCDTVALNTGIRWGLCDAMDNRGVPYPSACLHRVLEEARARFTHEAATGAERATDEG